MLSYRVFILKNIAFICFFNILNERKINQLKEINRMKKKKRKIPRNSCLDLVANMTLTILMKDKHFRKLINFP